VQQLPKIPLSIPAWLFDSELHSQQCLLNAMTLEGLLVEAGEQNLIPGTTLTVVFYLSIAGIRRRCQENVVVDEVHGCQAGLRFQRFDNCHSCNVEKLVHFSRNSH